MVESSPQGIAMTRRYFAFSFYFPRQLAEGNG
jgi:hypothetical protein